MIRNSCIYCAISLPESIIEGVCGQCLQKSPPFDVTHALYFYQSPITKLILELKFNQKLIHARVLGELLADQIQQVWYKNKPLPTFIIPVPLHPARLKERGFNQSLEIARPIAKILNLSIDITQCHRHKLTAPQSACSAAERKKNVKGAFSVIGHFAEQHVAVIDDVITTGNTVTEFCKTLKRSGARKIDVWCCARVDRLFSGDG
jgi:ComF family protein